MGSLDGKVGQPVWLHALLLVCVTCACRAVCVVLPPLDGMRDYRQ